MATLSRDPDPEERAPAPKPPEVPAAILRSFGPDFERLYEMALWYARKKMNLDARESREVVIAGFYELWTNRYKTEFESKTPVSGRLIGIVHFRALDSKRKTRLRLRREENPVNIAEITDRLYDPEEAESELDVGALLERIREYLPRLPERCRQVIQLVDIQGMSVEAAADVLGDVSPDTVRSHRTRGRFLLREFARQDGLVVAQPKRGRPRGGKAL